MIQTQTLDDAAPRQGHLTGRILAFFYGIAAYVVFCVTLLYTHRLRRRHGGAEND